MNIWPSWVFLAVLASFVLVQLQYLLLKHFRVIGMGLAFFMLISYVYLSSAIGTTATLSGLPALVKNVNLLSILKDSLRVTLMDKQPVSASSSDCWSSSDFWRLPISSFQRSLLKQRKLNQAYEKMMYLLFVFSLIPVVAVSADDFIDNRLQVNNSRLETEQEKDTWGQLDATESLFNEKDQKN